jgi:hypothetical protein
MKWRSIAAKNQRTCGRPVAQPSARPSSASGAELNTSKKVCHESRK